MPPPCGFTTIPPKKSMCGRCASPAWPLPPSSLASLSPGKDGKMNPGKVVDPYRVDENLRLGADYHPAEPKTHFRFPDDHGSFAHATLRCVGVGLCRREHGKPGNETMCPSYMVTHEEMHATRGRAHLLWEMLHGDPIRDGWRDQSIKEALDLCLACKGCKGDCP